MSNPRTFSDMAKFMLENVPGLDALEARKLINRAYVNESMGHCWSFLIKRFMLQTEAVYSTGSIAVTSGSTAVTLSGGAWVASWSTSPSNRRIAIQGRNEPYDITITAPTTGTLADPWAGADDSDATYVLFRDTYPLPSDCGYSKLMALYDTEQGFRLDNKNQSIFLREWVLQPSLTGIPELLMVVNPTSETPPRPQFQMYPAPSTLRAYPGVYFRRPDFMAADGTYPVWPHEFQDMIPLSAVIAHYSTPRFHSEKYRKLFMPMYADMFSRMVKAFDGDSAIDIFIEEIAIGRGGRRGNGAWNPNVLGFVGSGMTGS